jgi:hypothetical protein
MVGFALGGTYAVAFVSLIFIGAFDAGVSITRNSVMQLAAPPRMRGRIMANQGTVVRGFGPLAQTQSGAVASAVGGPAAILAAAAVMTVAAALVARANRPLWEFSTRQAVATGQPESTVTREPESNASGDPGSNASGDPGSNASGDPGSPNAAGGR